jgi:hypothetical protein
VLATEIDTRQGAKVLIETVENALAPANERLLGTAPRRARQETA